MNRTVFWSLISRSLQSNYVTSGKLLNLSGLYFSSSSEEWESYNLLCRVTGFSLLKTEELQHGEAQPCCTEDENDNNTDSGYVPGAYLSEHL